MSHIPSTSLSTNDLSILAPDLRHVIASLPRINETADSPDAVVKFMRSIPLRPYDNPDAIVRDVRVPGPVDTAPRPSTTVRVFTPRNIATGELLPVVLWSHHGGFFSMSPARLDPFCTSIAVDARVIIVAPAYRQSPEHPFPARMFYLAPFDLVASAFDLSILLAFEDVYQVLLWLTESDEVSHYGIDASRIAIGGTSAGAALAVGTLLRYRDEGRDTAKIRLLLLDDGAFTDASTSYSTAHNPVNRLWNAKLTRFMWNLYLPHGSEALDAPTRAYAVPAFAENFADLPPILCAQWDDLTNDAIAFAHRLLEQGVAVEIHTYRGTFHVSDKLVPTAKSSLKKRADIVEALKAAFNGSEEPGL
ncbi:hypothetical protein HGRIS_012265 [Hohenbuehelia grisea]|uniref:Alpha/beta hydrolase fold-3 domain-containing protein n=1 Tax=Hohenbuehelia grisea TaxID=104357 RepID=A0ABR3IRU0_9AGAR